MNGKFKIQRSSNENNLPGQISDVPISDYISELKDVSEDDIFQRVNIVGKKLLIFS